jgi:ammonia channel protein AmtB
MSSTLAHATHSVQIYKRDNGFNTNEIANGMLACLVAVTGCCPFIDPLWALLIGRELRNVSPVY